MRVMVIGGSPDADGDNPSSTSWEEYFSGLAKVLVRSGHDLIVCSPFDGSADHAILLGASKCDIANRIEFHYPDSDEIRAKVDEWDALLANSSIDKFPHPPPETDSKEAHRHSWLVSQLSGLDRSSVLIAIGGRVGASAELLLKLAHSRGHCILPLTTLGGASKRFFEAHRFEYNDSLGDDVVQLHRSGNYAWVPSLLGKLTTRKVDRLNPQVSSPLSLCHFFLISIDCFRDRRTHA